MSFQSKTNQQVIDHIKNSGLTQAQKNKIVKTLEKDKYSGEDLVNARDIDELKDMGFGFAAAKLMDLIKKDHTESKMNEQQLIQQRVREQVRRQQAQQQRQQQQQGARGVYNNQNNMFAVKYRYDGKAFITNNKFTMYTQVSEFITVLAKNEIGIDPAKTQVVFLGHKWSVKETKTLGGLGFDKRIECLVSLRVVGGMAALADDEKSEIRERFPDWNNGNFKPTLDADSLLFVKDNNLRVKMPCGHVFGPQCIYEIIKMCAENTSVNDVSCPMEKCGKVWDFKMLIAAADLNDKEISRFSNIFTNRKIKNSADTRICANCSNLIERPENLLYTRVRCTSKACASSKDFCWICGKSWQGGGFTVCGNKGCVMERVNDILQKCEEKVLGVSSYSKTCPVFRACPRCATLVEYDSACKHMKCWGCNKKFCFYCLGLQKDDGGWGCQSYGFQCEVAPRQKFK